MVLRWRFTVHSNNDSLKRSKNNEKTKDNKEKNALKNFVESSKPTSINREAVHQTAPTAAPKIHLLMRRCLIGRKVACTRSNKMAERLVTEASTRDLPTDQSVFISKA